MCLQHVIAPSVRFRNELGSPRVSSEVQVLREVQTECGGHFLEGPMTNVDWLEASSQAFVQSRLHQQRGRAQYDNVKRAFHSPGTGMLFVFESDGHRQFWMKNMHFPLDMVWIGSDCAVGEISGEVPASPPGTDDSAVVRVSPEEEAQYVMEINGGEAAALGLAANDPVSFAGTIAEQYGC